MRALATWRNPPVRVRVDGVPWLESPVVNVMIANGRYLGGRLQTLGLTRAVYAGTHLARRTSP